MYVKASPLPPYSLLRGLGDQVPPHSALKLSSATISSHAIKYAHAHNSLHFQVLNLIICCLLLQLNRYAASCRAEEGA